MGLNRNAAPLKSQQRLEREMYKRDEARSSEWKEKSDAFMLGTRPRRGELSVVHETFLACSREHPDIVWAPNVCMHCWGLVIAVNADPTWGTTMGMGTQNVAYTAYATPKAVKGAHGYYEREYYSVPVPENLEWVHATSALKRCYRDAGCMATYMPGVYLIEEMDM